MESSQRELIDSEKASKFLSKNEKYYRQSFLNGEVFYYILPPKCKLVVVGAVHIAQYLVEFGNQFDFDIYVIDPRSSFANKKRFPNVSVIDDWPDDALKSIKIDKEWNEQAARKQLLEFFSSAGIEAKETISARKKLATLLFS